MPQLLIKAGSRTSFEVDDIVVIVDDDHVFGANEKDPDMFKIVHIDKPKEELRHLVAHDFMLLKEMLPKRIISKPKILAKMIQRGGTARKIKSQRRYQLNQSNEIIDKRTRGKIWRKH